MARRKKNEYWQSLDWWSSLDASGRQKIYKALEAYCRQTGRRRPRKKEMKSLIEEALGVVRERRRKKAAPQRAAAEIAPQPAPATDGDRPSTAKEHAAFMARVARLVRDVLPTAGVKEHEAVPLMRAWLIAKSGKPKPHKISALVFERLLAQLEGKSPEEVLVILKKAAA